LPGYERIMVKQNSCLTGKDEVRSKESRQDRKGQGQREGPEQETEEQLPGQEIIRSEARTIISTVKILTLSYF
jgi:hypothetical protein